MAENVKRKLTFPELSALRYDLAYDVYRQRVHTEMLAAASKGEVLPYYAYKWFPDQITGLALVLNPYWVFDHKLRDESNKLALKWYGYSVYPPSTIQANRRRTRVCIPLHGNTCHYTVYGTIVGEGLHWTGSGWGLLPLPTTYNPANGSWDYALQFQGAYDEVAWDTTWKSRNPGLKQIPKKTWKKNFGLVKPTRPKTKRPSSNYKGKHPIVDDGSWSQYDEDLNKYKAARRAAVKALSKQKKLKGVFKRADADSLCSRGEAEFCSVQFHSTKPSCSWTATDYAWNDFWTPSPWTNSQTQYQVTVSGGSAVVAPETITTALIKERDDATNEMADLCDSLVAKCLPNRRRYNAFYQLGELKDLPQLLRGTLSAWRDLQKVLQADFVKSFSKSFWTKDRIVAHHSDLVKCNVYLSLDQSASSAYLTYLFGWQSIQSALEQLLKAPERVSKDINYLLENNGKLVRLSTIARLRDDEWPSHPAITPLNIQPMLPDPSYPISTTHSRTNRSIRCVVECGIMMPTVDAPKLRDELVLEKFGLWPPRPSDIYNLIPWSWLVDWFADLGGYLSLVEEIQMDKQLINWGMLTYKSTLKCTATCGSFMDYTDFRHNASGSVNSLVHKRATIESSGTFEASYFLRRSVESLQNVNTKLAKGLRLSSGQASILMALASTHSPIAK